MCKFLSKLNKNDVFYLDDKPSSFSYNTKPNKTKLTGFGHSFFCEEGKIIKIIYDCGIEVLATPQQDEYRNDAKKMKLSSDTKLTYIHAPLCNNEQFRD